MPKIKKLLFFLLLLFAFFGVAHFAMAQPDFGLEYGQAIGLTEADPRVVIANIIRVILGFLGILAVAIIIYGGFVWMTAAGDEQKIEKAKKILVSAIIGLIIILSAFAIASYLINSISDATNNGGSGETFVCDPVCGTGEHCCPGNQCLPLSTACTASSNSFYITGTSPGNGARHVIRNVVFKVYFNRPINSSVTDAVAANIINVNKIASIASTTGEEATTTPEENVPRTVSISIDRDEIDILSNGSCGTANVNNCFEAWSKFRVDVAGNNVAFVDIGGRRLSCNTRPCSFVFSTDDRIDLEPPRVGLNQAQICQETVPASLPLNANTVGAWASDDNGLADLRFYYQLILAAEQNDPPVILGQDRTNLYANHKFNTAGWQIGQNVNIRVSASDMDSHSTSTGYTTDVKPGHCCNGVQDADEEDIDCGGADCLACVGGPCNITEPNACGTDNSNCSYTLCSTWFCPCLSDDCLCQRTPVVYYVSPEGGFCKNNVNQPCLVDDDCAINDSCDKSTANGAAGNFATIGGRYFGSSTGTVEFYNGTAWQRALLANDPAQGNPACGSSVWKDNQIIVIVPNNLAIGSNTPIRVTNSNDYYDTTDDSRGPFVKFIPNTIIRPGLCLLNPDQASQNITLNYNGIRLTGMRAFFGNIFSAILANDPVFNNNLQGTAIVPTMDDGLTSAYVINSITPSNYLNFTKIPEVEVGPEIISFDPPAGATGTYITIMGQGFGMAKNESEVYFGPASTTASYDFPLICADSIWKDNQVIVKVPDSLPNGSHMIIMEIAGRKKWVINTSRLSPSSFLVDSSLPLAPSACRISPAMGQANTTVVSLWGEYFDAFDPNYSRIRFNLNHDQSGRPAIGGWIIDNSQKGNIKPYVASTTVHALAVSGPVKLVKGNNPEIAGNGLNFRIGLCAHDADCGAGNICCPSDTYSSGRCRANIDECYIQIPNSVYEWTFDTGSGIRCDGNLTLSGCQANQSMCPPNYTCYASSSPNDPLNCTCQPGVVYCDSNTANSTCDADPDMCPDDVPYCDGDTCTCTPAPPDFCSGFNLSACATFGCPNSPGDCSVGVQSPSTCDCDLLYGAGANLDYNIATNKCASTTLACSIDENAAITVNGDTESLANVNAACNRVNSGTSAINYYWQMNPRLLSPPQGSCPNENWVMDSNNQCTLFLDNQKVACTACLAGNLSCAADGGGDNEGLCAAAYNVCAAGSTCDLNNNTCATSTPPENCECCCRIGYDGQDCCAPLRCEGNCGADALNPTSDEYGYCSGCRIESAPGVVDVAASDNACNCSHTSGKYCDTDADMNGDGAPDGICRDCVELSNSPSQCSAHETQCCVDYQSPYFPNYCNGWTGNRALDIFTGNNYALCQYFNCYEQSAPTTGCNNTASSSGFYKNLADCEDSCPQVGGGESCFNPLQNACTLTCAAGYNCLGDSGCYDTSSLGNRPSCANGDTSCLCCCDPNASPDWCENIETGDTDLELNCHANVEPCSTPSTTPDTLSRGMCCGCRVDSNCGDPDNIGCGYDTCCRQRPDVAVVYPENNSSDICRNSIIEAEFDQEMSLADFVDNFIIVADFGQNVCPADLEYLTLNRQKPKNIIARIYHNIINNFKKIIARIKGDSALAQGIPTENNFCVIPGSVRAYNNAAGHGVAGFYPAKLLPANTDIYAIVKGDKDLNSAEGVKSIYSIGMNGPGYDDGENDPTNMPIFNGKGFANSYVWKFSTLPASAPNQGLCLMDHCSINPSSYLFKTNINDPGERDDNYNEASFDKKRDSDKLYIVYAMAEGNQRIAPIADIYDWIWGWESSKPSAAGIFGPVANLPDDRSLIMAGANVVDDRANIIASTSLSGSYADPNGENFICQSPTYVFICDNPWPAIQPDGTWFPWSDTGSNCSIDLGGCQNTNNELYYCRDAGNGGTADDLPAIATSSFVRGSSTTQNYLKEIFFLREQIPNTAGNLTVTGIDTGGQVSLAWDLVAGASEYRIYYGTASGRYTSSFATTTNGAAVVSGLRNGTRYYFAVTSRNLAGAESPFSNEVNYVPFDSAGPIAPSIAEVRIGDREIIIAWADESAHDARSFRLYYGVNTAAPYGSFVNIAYQAAGETDVGQLQNGVEYKFGLVAYDQYGHPSATTTALGMPLARPVDIVAEPKNRQIDLSWPRASGAESYIINYGLSAGNLSESVTVYVPSSIISGLTNGTRYYFNIISQRLASGRTYVSESSSIVSATPFGPPANLSGRAETNYRISLWWEPAPGADSYRIYYGRNQADLSDTRDENRNGSFTDPIVFENLRAISTTYYFQIKSLQAGIESIFSQMIDITSN